MTIKPGRLLKASIILLTAFASCKETEKIKRDIIITPAGSEFTIPVISNTNSGQLAGAFEASVNVEEEMHKVTGEFGINNITDLRITALKLELVDTPITEENNLGNLEGIQAEISGGGKKVTLTRVTDNPSSRTGSVMLPVSASGGVFDGIPNTDLKDILNASPFNYDIRVKLRKPTTKELKARVTASYTVTVGF
jgi:hypothetical protein